MVAARAPAPISSPIHASLPPAASAIQGAASLGLKYLGFVEARGTKAAGFVDPDGHIILCVEKRDCDGRYHVWRIGVESVDMSYVDGTGRRLVPSGGGF